MKRLCVLGTLILAGTVIVAQQAGAERTLDAQLKRLFPAAVSFSPKQSVPPHFKAFANDPRTGAQTVLGLAFWTTELEPLERGYDGPIKILVGMNLDATLAGIVVADHHEPYGYFSVDPPEFAVQFAGKNIREPFRVGGDVDAVSRASITINSATRAIRNSARRVARQLLTP